MTHLDRHNEIMSDTVSCTEFVLVAGSCQREDQENVTASVEFKIWLRDSGVTRRVFF